MNKIRNMALPFICLLALLPLQSRAQGYWSGIGVKIGNNLALDYKIFVTERQALDLSIGILEPFDGIDKRGPQFVLFSPDYLFHFPVSEDGFSLFIGPGVSLGAQFGIMDDNGNLVTEERNFYFSVDAAMGVEYKLPDVPLALAFEWSPKLQLAGDERRITVGENGKPLRPKDWYDEKRHATARLGDLTIGIRYTF
ncbi:MAG: hypothetical protein IAB93_04495 [Bacteroidetes bacterium]|uniref:Outer membrane protein beta-barrel domain-containing protein n=1 Tax=Candidatus Merdivivens pullistercoris TaxID=2840873 RepID=A0A9D9N9G8_9BACT|nr:hypothetical protein [Candidatus Merdivivens pullistercoris]